jgi:hypothetical protein
VEACLSNQVWPRVDQFNEERQQKFGGFHDSTSNRSRVIQKFENLGKEAERSFTSLSRICFCIVKQGSGDNIQCLVDLHHCSYTI